MEPQRNVAILGADPFNAAKLEALDLPGVRFHAVLGFPEARELVYGPGGMDALLRTTEQRLDDFPEAIHGLVTWWDFPLSTITPYLAHAIGLPAAPVEAVLKCEHKYWSRLEQRAAVPDVCPRFEAVDPFDPGAADRVSLDFPFWLKPVKSHSSHLGFRIASREELRRALAIVRQRIGRIAAPFQAFLRRVALPPEVAAVDAYRCVAEEIISRGDQCTLEGFVHGGEVVVYGAVDSIRYPGSSSFARYQYPSRLPQDVLGRMAEAARRFLEHVGYDDAPFNIEFFHDPDDDRIRLLEVNARISQSHGDLFHKVDGAPHHGVAVGLALGRRPLPPAREGAFDVAAKCFLRHFENGVVTRTPTVEELEAVGRHVPGALVGVQVAEGTRLSELTDQDSYSYNLAELYVGGADEAEIERNYERVTEELGLEFSVEPGSARAA